MNDRAPARPNQDNSDGAALATLMPALMASTAGLYARWLDAYGITPRGAGWSSPARQQAGFDALLRLLPAGTPPAASPSIVDVGCGYGALFEHIRDAAWFAGGRYLGLDICQAMIEAAQARIDDPRARFAVATVAATPGDYAVAHGVWNLDRILVDGTLLPLPRDHWRSYVCAGLRGLARAGTAGFGFTMLSHRAADQDPNLHYADPAPYVAFCRDHLGGTVELLQDYTDTEWAILVRGHRQQAGA